MPAKNNIRNAIYVGDVFHERHRPFVHRLKYRVFSFCVDLDDLPRLSKTLRFFSFNRWNITAIMNKDHGKRDGSDLRPWILKAAKDKNIDLPDNGKIFMLCFPRLWGYVFTPLTIFFCYDNNYNLKATLYQVKNTFGEQHGYMLAVDDPAKDVHTQDTTKIFHVSPFIEMDCTYKFRFRQPDDRLDIGIHQFTKDGKILTATWNGQRLGITDRTILKMVLRHPLMTFKVIVGIHIEALKLVIKGTKYIRKPAAPSKDIS